MATPDSIGVAQCCNCGREVFVRKNRGNFAYYRCEGCGIAVQHHIARHSDAWVKSHVKLENVQAPEPEKKPDIPAAKPVAQAKPTPPAKELSAAEKFLRGEK